MAGTEQSDIIPPPAALADTSPWEGEPPNPQAALTDTSPWEGEGVNGTG